MKSIKLTNLHFLQLRALFAEVCLVLGIAGLSLHVFDPALNELEAVVKLAPLKQLRLERQVRVARRRHERVPALLQRL